MKHLLLCALLFAGTRTLAQRSNLQFDHLALHVRSLDSSVRFYSGLLELDSIPNPFPAFPVKWYDIGGGRQLHVIAGAKDHISLPILQHPCFSTSDIDRFIARLKAANVPYFDANGKPGVQVRGDGVTQLFIADPDGNWIEINNRKH